LVAVLVMPGERISETYHPERISGDLAAPYVSVRAAIAAFGVGGVLVAGLALEYGESMLFALSVYAAIAGPLCVAAIVSRKRQTDQAVERTVALEGGLVKVTTATDTEAWPLEECCWFRGKATDDENLSYQRVRAKTVVLVFPTGRTLACGLSEPTYSEWLDAVRANRCRRVLRQEGMLGLLVGLLSVAGLIGGLTLGWRLGGVVQQALIPQAANNSLANVIPGAMGIVLAWTLAVSPLLIPGWRRYTERERSQLIRFAIRLPAKLAVPAGAALGGNLVSGLLLAAIFAIVFIAISLALTRKPPSRTARCIKD